MQHHHSYAAQKNNKAHNPHKKKRANRDKRGGDPKQPVGLRYSKNQIDNKNTNTFESVSDPAREEVGEFRDGCFVLDDSSSSRPANCIELARPKLKSTAKDMKIRDFKDGYFELRKDGAAKAPAQRGTGDVRSASAPVLLTPDHFRSQSSTHLNSALYSSQQKTHQPTKPVQRHQPPHQLAQQPLHQFSAPSLQAGPPSLLHQGARLPVTSHHFGAPTPSSSLPNGTMHYHQQVAQQQQAQRQHPAHTRGGAQQQHSSSFSFQSFAQGVAATTASFRRPPTHQVVHANDLAKARAAASQPLTIPVSSKARPKSPEKRSSSPPVSHAKWAGGGYSNSPHPSLLPAPIF